jgi:hypothetical protein
VQRPVGNGWQGSAMSDTYGMNRDERIEKARRMAAEHAPGREDGLRKRANRLHQRLANVGASQAQRHVAAAEQSGTAAYLDPAKNEWEDTIELSRLITIARAKRRDTITYGEIKWALYDELRMLVDPASWDDLLLAINLKTDGVLLASIAVHADNGEPSDDFLLAGMELGFDLPVQTLQRQVYEHFG